jgi:hypothetical protein
MSNINFQFLTVLIIIAIGFTVKKTRLVEERFGEGISKVILNVTLPALILVTFTNIEIKLKIFLLPLICLAFGGLMLFISFIVFKGESRKMRGLLMMSSIGFNIGLFAYPLVEGLWGTEGLTYIATFDIGNTMLIFGLCYVVACVYAPNNTGVSIKYILRKLVKLIPLWAYFIALIFNLIGVNFPPLPENVLNILAGTNAGLVYLLLGIYLNISMDLTIWKSVLKVIGIRYTAGIILGLVLFFVLPFSGLFNGIILIALIMPVGMTILPYSIECGYDEKIAGNIVNLSNLVSFLLIWIFTLIFKFN